ncbi:MAG: hypothetical protein HQK54_11790, partial [Oligoflexales bacterium]|nr:hypothetical protein [Oligoflexales bacterium]
MNTKIINNSLIAILAISFLVAGSIALASGEEGQPARDVKIGGYIGTDNRAGLKDKNIPFHEYRLDMKTEAKQGDKARFYGEAWLRNMGLSGVKKSDDLTDKDKVSPYNLDVREAYGDLYGFLSDNIDLRVGRQRIAWGTADRISPTDNLNPLDLEDIWDFGRHLGSDAIKATYYKNDFSLSVVYIPIFTPAVLPRGNYAMALAPQMAAPAGLSVQTRSDTVVLPENDISHASSVGLKLAEKNFMGLDLSLSYVHTRDSLPMVESVALSPAGTSPAAVNLAGRLIYPRMNILGADLAGSISSVGVWMEAATFFPEKVTLVTDLSALGMGTSEETVLPGRPYTKYVVGADYSF